VGFHVRFIRNSSPFVFIGYVVDSSLLIIALLE
jgi:hypothetical protein